MMMVRQSELLRRMPMTTGEKTISLLVYALAAWVFCDLGWRVFAPSDPHAAISLLAGGRGPATLLTALLLASIVALIATVLAGRILADVGTFSAALGLLATTWLGGNAADVLLAAAERGVSQRVIALQFAVESVVWILVIGFCVMLTAALVGRALNAAAERDGDDGSADDHPAEAANNQAAIDASPEPASILQWPPMFLYALRHAPGTFKYPLTAHEETDDAKQDAATITGKIRFLRCWSAIRAMAGFDVPQLGAKLTGKPLFHHTPWREGLTHALAALVAGFVLLIVIGMGLKNHEVTHAESCFLIAFVLWIGGHIAYQLAPVRSPLWPMAGALALPLVGYLWSSVMLSGGNLPPNMPRTPFLRLLPLQFVAAGALMAIAKFWWYQSNPSMPAAARKSAHPGPTDDGKDRSTSSRTAGKPRPRSRQKSAGSRRGPKGGR